MQASDDPPVGALPTEGNIGADISATVLMRENTPALANGSFCADELANSALAVGLVVNDAPEAVPVLIVPVA